MPSEETPQVTPCRGPVTVRDGSFWRGGHPHRIISGAIHYFRIHPDLWRDRLLRVRAMGLNTVETYVPWNFHERRRGEVDFTGPRDVARFVELAGDLGLDVIVRPGPFICAEWDFGGLPAWLMAHDPMPLRTSDPAFLEPVDWWFDRIVPVITPLQSTRGGPVVAVQVENEYGSYGDDAAYLEHLRRGLVERGVDVLLCTSDGPGADWLASGSVPGVLATANFGSRAVEALAQLRTHQPSGPDLCMEFWNGWFDQWGEPHHTRDAEDAAAVLSELLEAGASVNLYMAHGGTNLGLWNGAIHQEHGYQPTTTSYDYDAPVGEAGELTAKFRAFREVISRYAAEPVPEAPDLPARLAPQTVRVAEWASLSDSLGAMGDSRRSAMPLTMEDLGQDHGLVHYRGSVLRSPEVATLRLVGLADRAVVSADGIVLGTVERNDPVHEVSLEALPLGERSTVDVLVENQGRVNFGTHLGERKGLRAVQVGCDLPHGRVYRYTHGWTSTPLPVDAPDFLDQISFGGGRPAHAPVFARAVVEVGEPADGFIALPGWGKGFVWLNGELLGRYWHVGPQETLYAPAPLWCRGDNEIVVLELETPGEAIAVTDLPNLRISAQG